MTGPETFLGIKITAWIFAIGGAALSVLVEWRKHDFFTATGSIVAGVFMAVVATDPTLDVLSRHDWVTVSEGWDNAVSAGYGIMGRNLIIYLKSASVDPIKTIKSVWPWGKK